MEWTTDELAWLCLAMVPGVGPKTLKQLLNHYELPKTVYELDHSQLRASGLSEKSADHILRYPPKAPSKSVDQALQWAQQPNQHVITYESKGYPNRLKHIDTAPPFLMVKGRLEVLNFPQLAMVGSRYPSSNGAQQAYDFAQKLAYKGLTITSGLAKGVDGLVHQAALDAKATTIAVMGTGMDSIYPKAHRQLADAICEQGALVSEFPLGSKAVRGHFPRRNRIVSGMSLGVLVVEATLKSGSLITARQGLEQNREIMAIPGSIHNPQKAGCHLLIRQGAKLIETPDQVIEELAPQFERESSLLHDQANHGRSNHEQDNCAQPELAGDQLKVFNALDYDGLDMETLVNKTRLDVGIISMALMALELSGHLTQEQGLYAKR